MNADEDPVLSAQVVLRPRGGGSLTGYEAITAETVGAYLPDVADAQTAAAWFAGAGFQVHELVGLGFAIVGGRSTFERAFGARLEVGGDEARRMARGAEGSLALPLDRLPPEVARVVQAVEFTPPPDFGPTEY